MNLTSFRIRNYKSIKDSGICLLSSDITVLAGKNESGKTAILEALRDFDRSVDGFPEPAKPLDNDELPQIELNFNISKDFLNDFEENTNIKLNSKIINHLESKGLSIFKEIEGYYFSDEFNDMVDTECPLDFTDYNSAINELNILIDGLREYNQFSVINKPTLDANYNNSLAGLILFIQKAKDIFNSVNSTDPNYLSFKKFIDSLDSFELPDSNNDLSSSILLDNTLDKLPNIVFFSSFEDILPFEVPLSEAINKNIVKHFAAVSGLDLELVIKTTDKQKRINMLGRCSASINGDFGLFWKQSSLELIAKPDGDNLIIGIKEIDNSDLYKTEQRSKGFQWFLSFYLTLKAQTSDPGNRQYSIILIDEPGLYLHAKAQEAILKVLERMSENNSIIFSTHSPYLLDGSRFDRIRLIIKKKNKGQNNTYTIIENKIHKGADQDTLTPIITALGLDISANMSLIGKNNVITEGISDYYYLVALSKLIYPKDKLNFCILPSIGASQVRYFVSLLIGWDLKFVVILDNDKAGNDAAKILTEKLKVQSDRVIRISDDSNGCTEDLFSKEDFKQYVLGTSSDSEVTNCELLKELSIEKAIAAKCFLDKVLQSKEIPLSKTSLDNFKEIFDKLSKLF